MSSILNLSRCFRTIEIKQETMMRDEIMGNSIGGSKSTDCHLSSNIDNESITLLPLKVHRKTVKKNILKKQTTTFSNENKARSPKNKKVSFSNIECQYFKQPLDHELAENTEFLELLSIDHSKRRLMGNSTCHATRRTYAPFPDSLTHEISTLLYNASLVGLYSLDDNDNAPRIIHQVDTDNDTSTGKGKVRNVNIKKDDESDKEYPTVGASVSPLVHDGKEFRLTSSQGSNRMFITPAEVSSLIYIEHSQDKAGEHTTNDSSLVSCKPSLVEDCDDKACLSMKKNHEADDRKKDLLTKRTVRKTFYRQEDSSSKNDESSSCSSVLTSASLYHGTSKVQSYFPFSSVGASEEQAPHFRRQLRNVPSEIVLIRHKQMKRKWKGT